MKAGRPSAAPAVVFRKSRREEEVDMREKVRRLDLRGKSELREAVRTVDAALPPWALIVSKTEEVRY
jgi:hypothetical protein